MFATVRSYAASGGLVDSLVENEGAIRDLISEIEGFRAYYFVRGEGDAAVSVSVFDDRAGADESNSRRRMDRGEPSRSLRQRAAGDDRRGRRRVLS